MEFRDEVWKIETAGIEAVPAGQRHGRAGEVFWIWFAANIGILALVLGALLASYKLDFWQGLLVTILGGASFLFVGFLGIAGPLTGVPMLTLSRASFGVKGAFLPTLISWINLIGWQTVVWVTATYAGIDLFANLGVRPGPVPDLIIFAVIGILTYAFGVFGHATVVRMQYVISLVFGALTIVLTAYLLGTHHVTGINFNRPADFLTAFVPAAGFIIMFAGVSWINCSSDYTRYLPPGTSSQRIVWFTTIGSTIPLVILIMAGYLLSTRLTQLGSASDPLSLISQGIPAVLLVPYWIVGIAGLLPESVLAGYSSGLNLLALGVKLPRYKTIYVDFVLCGALGVYVVLSQSSFLGVMQSFLGIVVAVMTPFTAVLLTDLLWHRRLPYQVADLYNFTGGSYHSSPGYRGGFGVPALVSYFLGIVCLFLFGSFPLFNGPLATVFFQNTQTSYVLAFLVTGGIYNVWKVVLYGVKDQTQGVPGRVPGPGRVGG
ncbi:MAG TPA: cytosine permease [Spirochaetia bacterium]|nr:cytosine permease [Spirochaetia bacterium]